MWKNNLGTQADIWGPNKKKQWSQYYLHLTKTNCRPVNCKVSGSGIWLQIRRVSWISSWTGIDIESCKDQNSVYDNWNIFNEVCEQPRIFWKGHSHNYGWSAWKGPWYRFLFSYYETLAKQDLYFREIRS